MMMMMNIQIYGPQQTVGDGLAKTLLEGCGVQQRFIMTAAASAPIGICHREIIANL